MYKTFAYCLNNFETSTKNQNDNNIKFAFIYTSNFSNLYIFLHLDH